MISGTPKIQKECFTIMNKKMAELRTIPKTDSIVDSIIDRFVERAQVGMKKYGTNLDRTDLSLEQWLEHSIEEQLDNILYMQRALKELRETKTL